MRLRRMLKRRDADWMQKVYPLIKERLPIQNKKLKEMSKKERKKLMKTIHKALVA